MYPGVPSTPLPGLFNSHSFNGFGAMHPGAHNMFGMGGFGMGGMDPFGMGGLGQF